MGSISGACLSFIQYRMSFWRGNSWASSRSRNGRSSRGGGDGEAFLALSMKSVWFKVDGASISQSVSRPEAMMVLGKEGVDHTIEDDCIDRHSTTVAAFGSTRDASFFHCYQL